jgi:hypothetical protein
MHTTATAAGRTWFSRTSSSLREPSGAPPGTTATTYVDTIALRVRPRPKPEPFRRASATSPYQATAAEPVTANTLAASAGTFRTPRADCDGGGFNGAHRADSSVATGGPTARVRSDRDA